MAGEVRATPRRVLLDTNVFIIGYSDEASLEKRLLRFATTQRAELILLLSDEMKDQILRVAKRVRDKDWAGFLWSSLWRDFAIEYVSLEGTNGSAKQYLDKIPREDLAVFLTALVGRADCFVSYNRKLLKAALGQNPPFQCLTPEEFLNQFAVVG